LPASLVRPRRAGRGLFLVCARFVPHRVIRRRPIRVICAGRGFTETSGIDEAPACSWSIELAGLTAGDITLGTGANVHTIGKGRKERRTPLLPGTVTVLRAWTAERKGGPGDPLFPTGTGRPLSRDAIEQRIKVHAAKAAQACPSMQAKRVTAHTLRHTCAMNLLHAGNDVAVIALWLGHEQVSTTSIYLHADMTQKERAIARTKPLSTAPGRYRAPDSLLAFLESL
jgi:hypothetical protein